MSSPTAAPAATPLTPLVPIACELADLIRLESRSSALVANGLGVVLLLLPTVAFVSTLVIAHLWGDSRSTGRLVFQGATFLTVGCAGVLGLGAALVGLLRLVHARLARRSLERELASRLGAPLRLGGPGRGSVLSGLIECVRLAPRVSPPAGDPVLAGPWVVCADPF